MKLLEGKRQKIKKVESGKGEKTRWMACYGFVTWPAQIWSHSPVGPGLG